MHSNREMLDHLSIIVEPLKKLPTIGNNIIASHRDSIHYAVLFH